MLESTKLEIVARYKNGEKICKLSNEFGFSRQSIRILLKKENIKLRRARFTEDNLQNLIDEYKSGMSNKELTIKYRCGRGVIQETLKRNNVKLRKFTKYIINDDIFLKISCEHEAYFLGLLFADGSINKNNIEISLQIGDKSILEKFSEFVFGEINLKKRKGKILKKNNKQYKCKDQYRLSISRRSIASNIRKHGMTENKSLKIRLPKLTNEMQKHFIRGYFDGDGCICINNNSPGITILSNKLFLIDIQNIINKELKITSYISRKKDEIYCLGIYGRLQIIKFMEWLYNDATLYLERKYSKFLELKNKF